MCAYFPVYIIVCYCVPLYSNGHLNGLHHYVHSSGQNHASYNQIMPVSRNVPQLY